MVEGRDPEGVEQIRRRLDDRLDRALRRSYELGFLGSMPIADQIDHALGFVAILEEVLGAAPSSVIDLGTGGGVPGLVLARCWPDTRVVLMDASERRTTFLLEVLEGWTEAHRAEVLRGRAEDLGRREGLREAFDAVTSRSFGLAAATAECGSSFLEIGGLMVVSEPPDTPAVDRWPREGLAVLGLTTVEAVRPTDRYGYQILRKTGPLDDRYPRRVGVPVKRPAF
jgi:16S rRNA (guanine527-N7)-methyltransferase